MPKSETALIVGAGLGLSASLARRFSSEGVKVALAARNIEKLDNLVAETNAKAYTCDATDPAAVEELFSDVTDEFSQPDIVIYNASNRVRGPITDIDPECRTYGNKDHVLWWLPCCAAGCKADGSTR